MARSHQFWTNLGSTMQAAWHWKLQHQLLLRWHLRVGAPRNGVGGRMVEAICHRQQNRTACHNIHNIHKMRKVIARLSRNKNSNKQPIITRFSAFHINFPDVLHENRSQNLSIPASAPRVRPALHRRRGPAQLGIGGIRPGAQAIGDPSDGDRWMTMAQPTVVASQKPKYLSNYQTIKLSSNCHHPYCLKVNPPDKAIGP